MYRAAKNILPFMISSLLLVTPMNTSATNSLTHLGKVSYSGNACPAKSTSVRLSNNKKLLKINFKKYSVNTGGSNRKNIRKKCSITVPIRVKKGWSVSLISANYRGKHTLPSGSSASVTTAYSFAGQRGRKFHSSFKGPNHKAYNLHDPLSHFANVWSKCGGTAKIRISSSVLVKPNALTSLTTQQSFSTRLRYRKCQ